MRGHADPAQPRLSRAGRRAAAGLVVVLAAVLVGGPTVWPLLAPLAALLVILVRHARLRPAIALVLLTSLLAGWRLGDHAAAGAATALMLIAAAGVGWLWRREALRTQEKLDQLDDIMALADSAATRADAAAAGRLADLERALAAVTGRLHAESAVIWDTDGWNGTARPRAVAGPRPRQIRLSGDPLGWVWEQGMRLRIDPPPRWAPDVRLVVAERLVRDEHAGLLVSWAFQHDPPEDTAFEEAAIYLRGIIALHDAEADVTAGRRRISALLSGLRNPPGRLELDTIARELCNTAMAVTDATGALIATWTGEHGTVLAACGEDGGPAAGDVFVPPESELAQAVRADTQLVRQAPDWTLGRTCLARPEERWSRRPRALAVQPLHGTDGVLGVIAVWSSRRPELDPTATELLHALAPYASLHLDHARAYGRMRETAERDPLTGLRNRRAFDDVFHAETVRWERYGRPVSLMVLDLDHFKSINDRFGHEAGDEVLKQVAETIGRCIRDIDTAARFGGEEFVVLLPETPLSAAADAAERVRAAVAASVIYWKGQEIPVRVSIGVSSCPETTAAPADLIATADAALYEAKAAGRDTVRKAGGAGGGRRP